MPQSQPVTDPLSLVHHIDRQTIEHLAALARIRLTAEETAGVEEHLHKHVRLHREAASGEHGGRRHPI